MAVVADPERRTVLLSLRDFWIALGDELPRAAAHNDADRHFAMPLMLHAHLSTVIEIHAQLMADCRNAMH